MNRSLFFLFAFAVVLFACSGRQDLGSGGKSKAGETCSNSSECADSLRCTRSVCGGSTGTEQVSTSGPPSSLYSPCKGDGECANRAEGDYCKQGGTCTECLTDDHCALKSSHHCKVAPEAKVQNSCVDCLTDAQCTDPAAARCSESKYGNYCVACLADADCKDAKNPRCELTQSGADSARLGYCKECLANADCRSTGAPICRSGYCRAP